MGRRILPQFKGNRSKTVSIIPPSAQEIVRGYCPVRLAQVVEPTNSKRSGLPPRAQECSEVVCAPGYDPAMGTYDCCAHCLKPSQPGSQSLPADSTVRVRPADGV